MNVLSTDATRREAVRLLAHPRMIELVAARRRFFTYAWVAFLGAAVLLFGCAAFTPAVLALQVVDGVSLGFVLGIGYIALILLLTQQYAIRARRWDALIAELRAAAGFDGGQEAGR